MQILLIAFFTFVIVYSPHVTTSSALHGENFPPLTLFGDVAINCGCLSNSTAHEGRYWVGETSLLRPKGKSTASTSANRLLTVDPTPYLTARISFSNFFYHFQLNPGQKFIRFHFSPESYQGFDNSQDLFTVKANSFTLLQNFSASLAVDALGVKHVVKEFLLNVNETGILQIAFFALQRKSKTSDTYAFVNGIEIISMPTGLYYTIADNIGSRIVGQKNHFDYVDNSTALELVLRLNVGGSSISPVDDTGMFRRWTEDVYYLQESGFQQTSLLVPSIEHTNASPYVAPLKIYQTSRKLRKNLQLEDHFTWKIPVDVGFAYLVRLHFCYFGVQIPDGGAPEEFSILIQDLLAETQVDVMQLIGGKRIPVYKDYLVVMKGDKAEGKQDLFISLQSSDELVLGLLKGLEIFKLSNTDNSLASPNPYCPKQTSSFWTLKIQNILLPFGQINAIMTALTIFLAIVNFGVYQLRRICECMHWHERNELSALEEPSCRRFSLTEILLATQDFNEALVIGKGGFGKVYKGFIHRCPEIVAIKRLKPESKQGAHEFWREIETLSKLRHMNLVSLLGYCMEREEMILVYEYMPRGTVADNLYKTSRNGKEGICLTWEQRLNICIGAAHGLDYLHSGTQHGIIHRDVKDTNILLDQNFVSKISDFGMSKFGKIGETQDQLSTNIKGTRGYMDPDYLMTHKPSTKSDIYAFGIVMLVVLSGRPALETSFFSERQNLLSCFRECMKKGEMKDIIDPCLQEDILTESLRRFIDIVRNCLHRRPKKRPTMAQVVVHLEHALHEHLGAGNSTRGTDTIVGQTSPARSNLYELQVAPVSKESIISLPGEDNTNIGIQNANLQTRAEVLHTKGKYDNITQKLLRGITWVALRNIRKPTKKMKLDLRTARVFSLKEIKLATQNFSDKLIIGQGGFGSVYKVFINGGSGIVALKRLRSDSCQGAEEFRTEVEMLSTINYIHLVPFVGYCNENNESIIMYEYMSRGALNKHIYGNNGSGNDDISLTWEQRLRICIGAARGLNYLHEVGIIHRDVKDSNIMLDENFVAKISVFGLSKLLLEQESHVTTRIMGTFGYVDPSYMATGRLTKASDVYSFGIVLLVVLSGMPVFDRERPEVPLDIKSWYDTCFQEGNYDELIDPKLVGGIPSASLILFLDLIKRCLHDNPKRRPVMAQVVVNLEEAAQVKG